jgi:carbamoyltransferase
MKYILGISAYYHDSAACLVKDGDIVAAAQEERFSRKKHDASFPSKAVEYCLSEAGITIDQVSYISFYEKPEVKFERIVKTFLAYSPKGWKTFSKAITKWMYGNLFIERDIREKLNYDGEVKFFYHHESHAMSAFYPSPFIESAVLTIDGVGEWATTTIAYGKKNSLQMLKEIRFPHSLGLLYSAFTSYIGFKVNSGEYKVMGLAPYGQPVYKDLIYEYLLDLKEDGSFHLNMEYFEYPIESYMTNAKFHKLFGGLPRKPETKLSQRDMDLARSVQDVAEEVVIRLSKYARKLTGSKNLCLAGGVALNCVANGRLIREKIFENVWIQPAAGDAGGAIGAALGVWYQILQNIRIVNEKSDGMKGALLGPEFSNEMIQQYLDDESIEYSQCTHTVLFQEVVRLLNQGKVIGWFQGRMEFGPRSLGARSIIGDARSEVMQAKMNLKIKFRESFRPFAPSILKEKAHEWFELTEQSPYMLLVAPVINNKRKELSIEEQELFGIDKLNISRSLIPAVTHVDYSARVQTVESGVNPPFYELLSIMDKQHGCPLIVNTSFNVRGEPPVCSPKDAYKCFMRTDMDYLVIGNFIIDKKNQKYTAIQEDWKNEYELD